VLTELRQDCDARYWRNKIVLIFEFEHSPSQVRQWLYSYKKYGVRRLVYRDELVNAMYVVSIDDELEDYDKALLIAKSPLQSREVFASVNDYHSGFNQVNPCDINHLVTLNITQASPVVHLHLKSVVSKVRRLIRSEQAPGVELHGISALVETTKRIYPRSAKIELAGVMQHIKFDVYNPHLRCQHCFSYWHFYKHCPTITDYNTGRIDSH
jgi:hypothetical protein